MKTTSCFRAIPNLKGDINKEQSTMKRVRTILSGCNWVASWEGLMVSCICWCILLPNDSLESLCTSRTRKRAHMRNFRPLQPLFEVNFKMTHEKRFVRTCFESAAVHLLHIQPNPESSCFQSFCELEYDWLTSPVVWYICLVKESRSPGDHDRDTMTWEGGWAKLSSGACVMTGGSILNKMALMFSRTFGSACEEVNGRQSSICKLPCRYSKLTSVNLFRSQKRVDSCSFHWTPNSTAPKMSLQSFEQ